MYPVRSNLMSIELVKDGQKILNIDTTLSVIIQRAYAPVSIQFVKLSANNRQSKKNFDQYVGISCLVS